MMVWVEDDDQTVGKAACMAGSRRTSLIWRMMRTMNKQAVKRIKSGSGPKVVLLLTTTGRKSGLLRQTPLQFEVVDGEYVLGSARGLEADWVQNILACPQVTVEAGGRQFAATAEVLTDAGKIADFFMLRLQRHPLMMRMMYLMEGLPLNAKRADFERLAAAKVVVVLRPEDQPVPEPVEG